LAGLDLLRLCKSISALVRADEPDPGLGGGENGYALDAVAGVLQRVIRRPVGPRDVEHAVARHGAGRLHVAAGRVRPVERGAWVAHGPDLLFHAVARARTQAFLEAGAVTGEHGIVHLSRFESQAWRVAHRRGSDPHVLYVDAARARREGVPFQRMRNGLYAAESIPVRHVLNLRAGFGEQCSAGGFLVDWSGAAPRVALVRVSRRGYSTWEVAKGKLELGENPAVTAAREIREEMGLASPVRATRSLGTVRYGYYTREGEPKLKTIFLYLLEADEVPAAFTPAVGEGIEEVRWFGIDEALDALAHPSLRGSIARFVQALRERDAELHGAA
jgi:RNA:NAD 2'-phosphotransferase (TPT1/KptA family)/ADP-ribose pyrophosphatase YjhB (NUDIX family)